MIEGSAIQLHPLVCSAFGADFDGDQMAIHIPLSYEAQLEASTLMLPVNNLLSPANGNPIFAPTQDITVGCYYLTIKGKKEEKEKVFSGLDEIIIAYELKKVLLHQPIKLLDKGKWIETTPGRAIFNEILPQGIGFENSLVDKNRLTRIIAKIWQKYGNAVTVEFLDKVKKLGFEYATKSGLTFAMSDVPDIVKKKKVLQHAEEEVKGFNLRAEDGEISEEERYKDVIDVRMRVIDQIGKMVSDNLSINPFNSLYMMWKSGARGSVTQLRQIIGMRGLMARSIRETYRRELWDEVFKRKLDIPSDVIKQYFYPLSGGRLKGRIGEEPVRSSFKEGLTAPEYFASTSGGRKGLVDTALKTAYAGYLTRKLVSVGQNLIINQEDCGAIDGLSVKRPGERERTRQSLGERILGRITVLPVINPSTGKVIIDSDKEITEDIVRRIEKAEIEEVKIRSPLTCQARWGLCRKCYGWDLSTHRLVSLGEAVGVIAAQSIGEPGTQLTLRTFHTGGIFQKGGDLPQGLPRATELFEPRKESLPRKGVIRQRQGDEALISEIEGIVSIEEREGRSFIKIKGENEEAIYEVGDDRLVSEGEMVEAGAKIMEGIINPRSLLNVKGIRAVEEYLVNQIQQVYRSQGVDINIKHFEVIIRQMMRKVEVVEPGDTGYIPGEQVDKIDFEEVNRKIREQKGKPGTGKPVLLAVPKAVQEDKESFLSAASFQRTKQVLAEAAICGQVDFLRGLKGNVIIGKLVPAGTGFNQKPGESTPV